MISIVLASPVVLATLFHPSPNGGAQDHVEITAEVVADKIRGGLLGQLFGNLNGLPYEFKFNEEAGNVGEYVPGLPEGARTDDDTDIEWVYVVEMERTRNLLLPYGDISRLWARHINRKIWVANRYARDLMSLGVNPPLTGHPAFNPKAHYNISGQFVCETFGLVCPALPRTAARTGLHYTRVTIDGEPAQATQLFTSMIATAFVTDDIERILDAGLLAVDPHSQVREIVERTRTWHREHPTDWRETRRRIQETYGSYPGGGNGYGVCTASVVAALLYGKGQFAETLRLAFNFGWDADNTAATAGTVLGVVKGRKWMDAEGWTVVDVYRNTTRDAMPRDETITSFADRLIALAELAIEETGGKRVERDGKAVYLIPVEKPANVGILTDPASDQRRLCRELKPDIAADLKTSDPIRQARGAYLALCLGLDNELLEEDARSWKLAHAALEKMLKSNRYRELRERVSRTKE